MNLIYHLKIDSSTSIKWYLQNKLCILFKINFEYSSILIFKINFAYYSNKRS